MLPFPLNGKNGNLNKGFDVLVNDSQTHTQKKALKAVPTHSDVPLSRFNNNRQLDFLIPTRAASLKSKSKTK